MKRLFKSPKKDKKKKEKRKDKKKYKNLRGTIKVPVFCTKDYIVDLPGIFDNFYYIFIYKKKTTY